MDPRSINFNVLHRHDPQICSIMDSTSYAVIYRYFHGSWSKTGLEGTMFIFQRESPPFHGVFVLNRQGLENLCEGLLPGWDVDLDEGLIIWRSAGATGDADDDVIYGVWVYEEKDRIRISSTMKRLIASATANREASHLQNNSNQPPLSLSHPVPRVPIITEGQSISLDQLFGVGSACSELPPPPISSLPHPGASAASSEEQNDPPLPNQVMSPDPSDLPKGMQLLDSLFQKAGLKSQAAPSHLPPSPETVSQPLSIHQLMQGALPVANLSSQPPLPPVAKPPSKQAPTSRRERRRSSNDSQYKQQAYDDGSVNPTHRALHHQSSRPDNKAINVSSNQAHGSRRSSGGSSTNSRPERLLHSNNSIGGHSQQQLIQGYPTNSTYAPAAIPIEANAEARNDILTLLSYPAATRPNNTQQSSANGQMIVSKPSSLGPGRRGPNGESPESFGSASRDAQFAYLAQGGGSNIHSKPNSHQGSQRVSPHHHHRDLAAAQLTSQQSHNKTFERSPGEPAVGSPNDSPRGPRQQHPRQGSQESLASKIQFPGPAGHSNVGPVKQGAWQFENSPKRALSPLNPASQQIKPAAFQLNNYQNWAQSKQISSPPHVNDSSRPNRSHSHGSSNKSTGVVINGKIAAESMDDVLSATKMSNAENGEEESPLDKKAFAVAINELMKNNGAFVDTLYARYLARYAARYL